MSLSLEEGNVFQLSARRSGREWLLCAEMGALKQAHAKSGKYAQDRMAGLYDEMGLSAGMGGMPQ